MNVPDYLKELLLQYNEVSVPGLGAFSMVRKNATYNEKEGKFYPPYHQVKFNPQPKDDNLFVKYLAEKKNILFETAKYIVEKFVSALLEQAARGSAAFADIGWFSKDNNELVFKPNDKLIIDPSFYGYSPIALEKLNTDKPKPVYVAPVVAAPIVPVKAPELSDEETEIEEPVKKKEHVNGWFVFFMVLISITTGLFCAYLMFPTFAERLRVAYEVVAHNKTDDTVVSKKKIIPILEKNKGNSADTENTYKEPVKKYDFEVVVSSFRTFPSAQAEVRRLEHLGLDAEILTKNVTGPLLKVSIFSAPTHAAADTVLQRMIKAGKINKNTSHIEEITLLQ
jgi:hypothetical protein